MPVQPSQWLGHRHFQRPIQTPTAQLQQCSWGAASPMRHHPTFHQNWLFLTLQPSMTPRALTALSALAKMGPTSHQCRSPAGKSYRAGQAQSRVRDGPQPSLHCSCHQQELSSQFHQRKPDWGGEDSSRTTTKQSGVQPGLEPHHPTAIPEIPTPQRRHAHAGSNSNAGPAEVTTGMAHTPAERGEGHKAVISFLTTGGGCQSDRNG